MRNFCLFTYLKMSKANVILLWMLSFYILYKHISYCRFRKVEKYHKLIEWLKDPNFCAPRFHWKLNHTKIKDKISFWMWAIFTNVSFVLLRVKVVIFCWKENIFFFNQIAPIRSFVRCWCNDICCVLHHDNLKAFLYFWGVGKTFINVVIEINSLS